MNPELNPHLAMLLSYLAGAASWPLIRAVLRPRPLPKGWHWSTTRYDHVELRDELGHCQAELWTTPKGVRLDPWGTLHRSRAAAMDESRRRLGI